MVFLVLTRAGYEELFQLSGSAPSPLWVNDGLLSEQELQDLRRGGVNVTNFTYRIDAYDTEDIENALATVREHHPTDRIWIEAALLSRDTPI